MILLPYEFTPSPMLFVIGIFPFLGDIYSLNNSIYNSKDMSGARSSFKSHFPIFASHLIEIFTFDFANLYTDNSVFGFRK